MSPRRLEIWCLRAFLSVRRGNNASSSLKHLILGSLRSSMYEVYGAFHNVALKSETSTKVSRKYVCISVRMYVKKKKLYASVM